MLISFLKKIFNIREGELKVSIFMLTYIFLIITTLLIVKPTVNALFLSELGIESLPYAFLAVAIVAIFSSFFYSKALQKYQLNKIIETTLIVSIVLLITLGVLLKLDLISIWILYFFYVWVAIYAVLSASQFWVLANLVYNVREAKRLFGFIGSGAILGGVFGGYLTSLLAPIVGIEYLFFIAAFILLLGIPLVKKIWANRVEKLNTFKQKKRTISKAERPFSLIRKSRHLSYVAAILAVSVIVAKLVDYLFSDFASSAISDPDELASFFAFWFSTFNLLSLVIQLFLTQRFVGIWGVGWSLLLLPFGILICVSLFFIFPELSIVILIKAIDGTLKQSVNKSAIELLSLPLPFELKNKTKSFIDVVIDSIATGIAGFILIFVIKGLELNALYISGIIILLVALWLFFVIKARTEYFKTFRYNLAVVTEKLGKPKKELPNKGSVIKGMTTVFENGTESQILFMLKKLLEINDKRFAPAVQKLLKHPSNAVKTAAIQNMYFLNSKTIVTEVSELLRSDDDALIVATLEYLLLHSNTNSDIIYRQYLDAVNSNISDAALYCLAKEAVDNYMLKTNYNLESRIATKIEDYKQNPEDTSALIMLLKTIGVANIRTFHPFIFKYLNDTNPVVVAEAILASGMSMNSEAIPKLLQLLPKNAYRKTTIDALTVFGRGLLPYLTKTLKERTTTELYHKYIPVVMVQFKSQDAINQLFSLIEDKDLNIRLEVIRSLNILKSQSPHLKFNKYKIVALILDECKLYHQTMSAMHSQIIISYRNRKKSKELISTEEREARASLLDLLEQRLDAGLERIFKLLGLKYAQNDAEIAYTGLMSEKQEAQSHAIEFLDNLLTGDLKRTLLPILEDTVIDVTSEDILQKIKHQIPTEFECFQMLLNANDQKIKLAVLYLIAKQKDPRYLPLVEELVLKASSEPKVKDFAQKAFEALKT